MVDDGAVGAELGADSSEIFCRQLEKEAAASHFEVNSSSRVMQQVGRSNSTMRLRMHDSGHANHHNGSEQFNFDRQGASRWMQGSGQKRDKTNGNLDH